MGALRPVSFEYNNEYCVLNPGHTGKTYNGFIAQEYATVFSDAVTESIEIQLYPNDNDPRNFEADGITPIKYKGLSKGELTTHLVAAYQCHSKKITLMQSIIDSLLLRVTALEII